VMHSTNGSALGRHIASGGRRYHHVQRGDLLIVVLVATSGATLAAILVAGPQLLLIIALLLQLLALLAFCSSVITITAGKCFHSLRPGLVQALDCLEGNCCVPNSQKHFRLWLGNEKSRTWLLYAVFKRFSSGV
jgi:hypothetical protein